MSIPLLEVNNLSYAYQNELIVDDLSFSLQKGEIATILGSSGSGKTTLLKLIAGLLPYQKGRVQIAGEPSPIGKVDFMMQEDLLLPWRSVIRNVTLVSELGPAPLSFSDLKSQAAELLAEVGLANCEDLFPWQLSGGMRQRASLARALMQKRALLLLDEPFGPLDVSIREQMYALLREIGLRHQMTMLMVTHDFRDALILSDHLFFFKNGTFAFHWSITDDLRKNHTASSHLLEDVRQAFIHP